MIDKRKIEELRQITKQGDDERDKDLPHNISGVTRIDNISYGPVKKWNLLDIYLPNKVKTKVPVIISIHGGGYCYGTKETYQFYGMGIAKRGFAFVNANYRLSPDVAFPKCLDDVNRYIHWVSENADKYNFDTNNVFLIGDSAGGQMAEQYIAIIKNEEYRKKFGYSLTELKFRALAVNSAALFMLDPGLISGSIEWYFPEEILEEKKDLINVEKYIKSNYLPTFICTANKDFLRDSSIKFDGFLTGLRVEHVFKEYGDKDNPRGHVFLINQRDSIADIANDDEMKFFEKFIVNKK